MIPGPKEPKSIGQYLSFIVDQFVDLDSLGCRVGDASVRDTFQLYARILYVSLDAPGTHTRARTHARTHAHARTHSHARTHTHTHTHTHARTHAHTHMHMYMFRYV